MRNADILEKPKAFLRMAKQSQQDGHEIYRDVELGARGTQYDRIPSTRKILRIKPAADKASGNDKQAGIRFSGQLRKPSFDKSRINL